jgi:hypothetical protein
VSPVKYELVSYIPEGGILHSHRRGNLKSYMVMHLVKLGHDLRRMAALDLDKTLNFPHFY